MSTRLEQIADAQYITHIGSTILWNLGLEYKKQVTDIVKKQNRKSKVSKVPKEVSKVLDDVPKVPSEVSKILDEEVSKVLDEVPKAQSGTKRTGTEVPDTPFKPNRKKAKITKKSKEQNTDGVLVVSNEIEETDVLEVSGTCIYMYIYMNSHIYLCTHI